MSGFSALLGFCLLAALTASKAKPVSDNIRQQINTIETRIRAHMDENPMKILIPLPEVVPIDQPISGLMSTLETLGAFQKMVDSLLKGQPQLSVDLKTLRSHLELAMGELPCPHKKVDKEHHKELDSFLMANETYPQYMVKLLQKYKTCFISYFTFFLLSTELHMCSFIVLMPSVRIYQRKWS
uniref:Leptin n=1 Tax=Denticeps clupeoides TaxID=299321 RepID=A0AAY4CYB1_9TELE